MINKTARFQATVADIKRLDSPTTEELAPAWEALFKRISRAITSGEAAQPNEIKFRVQTDKYSAIIMAVFDTEWIE